MKYILKLILVSVFLSSAVFGATQEKVVFSKKMDAKYDEKVYRKVTILFTEARLKLQKKYKKFLDFEYVDNKLTNKKEVIKYLKTNGARYYVTLDIQDKKKCKNNKCRVKYIIKVVDGKKKKNTSLKIEAVINNNEFTEMKAAFIKSNTKKLVKFLRQR